MAWVNQVSGDRRLNPLEKSLAVRICMKYLNRDGKAWPSHQTLARDMNRSVASIKRAQTALQVLGLLRVESGRRTGRSSRYSIHWPTDSHGYVVRPRPKIAHP
jgi:DNA-binding transcriptional MocR family regulator